MLNKNHHVFGFIVLSMLLLSGCSVGNRIGQNGLDVETTLGNIDVNDSNNAGTLTTTNGNVTIGQNAKVESVEVLNGNISIGNFSQAASLQTTNGNIDLGENVLIGGVVSTLNGNILIKQHAKISGNIITSTGDVFISENTIIKGDIIFERLGLWSSKLEQETPNLTIKNGVTIEGNIHLYHPIELLLDSSVDQDKIFHHYDGQQ